MVENGLNAEHKLWIDNASYEELLRLWRHGSIGREIFQGETGKYYGEVMWRKRDELGPGQAVAISKRLGW